MSGSLILKWQIVFEVNTAKKQFLFRLKPISLILEDKKVNKARVFTVIYRIQQIKKQNDYRPELEIAINDFPYFQVIWTVSTARKCTIDNPVIWLAMK